MKARLDVFVLLGVLVMFGCKPEELFEQPTVEVSGYTLLELPGEYANLEIDVLLRNNDHRTADLKDAAYTATIEGIEAETEQVSLLGMTIGVDEPLALSLPLTLKTSDAIQLLKKMDAGESLSYEVHGTFHVDDPILKLIDLPIDISGNATVEAGFEDLFEQPEVELLGLTFETEPAGEDTEYEFELEIEVENLEDMAVVVDKVSYVVTVEGIGSEEHSLIEDVSVAANGTVSLSVAMSMVLNATDAETLNLAIESGSVSYMVEGLFHVKELEEATADFNLPLYIEGSVDVEDLFEQPVVTVKSMEYDYAINGFTSYTIDVDVNCEVQNMDPRDVIIDEIEYTVTVEGVVSDKHYYTSSYFSNLSIAGEGTKDLVLPVSFNLSPTEGLALVTALGDGTASYVVDGTFHALSVDGSEVDMELPLRVEGSVPVSTVLK